MGTDSISLDLPSVADSMVNDTIFACLTDSVPNSFGFGTPDFEGDAYAYLVTDPNNRLIVSYTDTSEINFDQADQGEYRIWGLAYSGNLENAFGTDLDRDRLSDGCFGLSANFVTLKVDSAFCPVDTTTDDTLTTSVKNRLSFQNLELYPVPAEEILNIRFTALEAIEALDRGANLYGCRPTGLAAAVLDSPYRCQCLFSSA